MQNESDSTSSQGLTISTCYSILKNKRKRTRVRSKKYKSQALRPVGANSSQLCPQIPPTIPNTPNLQALNQPFKAPKKPIIQHQQTRNLNQVASQPQVSKTHKPQPSKQLQSQASNQHQSQSSKQYQPQVIKQHQLQSSNRNQPQASNPHQSQIKKQYQAQASIPSLLQARTFFEAPFIQQDIDFSDDHLPISSSIESNQFKIQEPRSDNLQLKYKNDNMSKTDNKGLNQTGSSKEVLDLFKEERDEDTGSNLTNEIKRSENNDSDIKDVEYEEALGDLPLDIKMVVQEKLKTLKIVKKPIIMQPDVKPINTDTKKADVSSTKVDKTESKPHQYIITKETSTPIPTRTSYYFHMPVYAPKYPKGIPKSFLKGPQYIPTVDQHNNQKNIPVRTGSPRYPTPSQNSNATTSVPSYRASTPTLAQTTMPMYNDVPGFNINQPMVTQTDVPGTDRQQTYSPSDVYADTSNTNQDPHEGSESPDMLQPGQKRISAFQRLGPLTQPKKPKLTINLLFNKEQAVREVVDKTEKSPEKYVPVHLREDILTSTDEIVMKYLIFWPWKKKSLKLKKTVTARTSKTVMLLEQEQMEEAYDNDNTFFQVSVKGYPSSWEMEDVLDVLLNSVKGKPLIPCFIEFTESECKFLVIRSRYALLAIHNIGFYIHKDDVELVITISQTDLTLADVEFVPKLVLKKKLASAYDGESSLKLRDFMKKDLSNFIYFPLNRESNQMELIQMQSAIAWDYLTELDLSHNRITTIDGFELPTTTPKLRKLDLSHNFINKVTVLLSCRELSLRSIKLEGNPLCHDYIDPSHYVRVVRMIFTSLVEIDGIPVHRKGEMPPFKRNYCPEDAKGVVEKLLEVYFPLLDTPPDERQQLCDMYEENAVLTITYNYQLRTGPVFRYFRNLFVRCRVLEEGELDRVEGVAAILRLVCKWPALQHDPSTFTVDVLYHSESTTVVRVGGIFKMTAESLAEDEHLLAFTRTFVIGTTNGYEYKIKHELVHWDQATQEYANKAFRITTISSKRLSVKLESTPDEDLKEKLIDTFMKLTELDKISSKRCLEVKNWNFKEALEYFTKLLKLDSLNALRIIE